MKTKYHYALLLFFAMAVAYIGYWLGPLMAYREGLSLFVFQTSYAGQLLSAPSGVVDYVTQFISQFFIYPWLAAVLLSAILTYIAWGSARWGVGYNVLSFVVPIWLVWLLGDMAFDLRVLTSIALVVLAAQSTLWIKKIWWSGVVVFLMMIACPLWAGVLALMLIVARVVGSNPQKNKLIYCATLLAAVMIGGAVDYYLLYTNFSSKSIFNIQGALDVPLFLLFIMMCLPAIGKIAVKLLEKRVVINFALIVIGMGFVSFTSPLDSSLRSLLAIDQKMRNNDYQGVIDIAKNERQFSRGHGFYVVLALAELGTLGEDLYKFPQKWGSTVLYHEFSNEPFELLMTAELYSRLGHWNYAYRSAMEGVVINTRPSARMLSMMARAATANGEQALAAKYMHTLAGTLFYRNAAQDIGANLEKIRHDMPRKNMSLGDGHNSYLFLSKAHQENLDNRLVYEYLMTDVMLKERLDLLIKYLPAAEKFYTTLPSLFQQAILVYWAKTGNGAELIDRYVKGEMRELYSAFTKIMNDAKSRPLAQREKMFEPYLDTYFYYITSDAVKK